MRLSEASLPIRYSCNKIVFTNNLKRKRVVQRQLEEMSLTGFANVVAGSYSGGTKRKLVVAIAMIGNPSTVFLDEPSTGMDPEAKRFMWDVISRISRERKKSAVILTTHAMDEAEALATKIGIMVDGSLRCLGSAQHIKAKYGGGYELEVKLHLIPEDEILKTVKAMGFEAGTDLTRPQVESLLENAKGEHLISQISESGSGSSIYIELKRNKVSVDLVVDWLLIERNGEKLKVGNLLKREFD